ncbi:MAG: DRTGG domain-containing protein [Dissulfurispiraceae bacterium]
MTFRDVVNSLSLDLKTSKGDLDREITGCYVSDLLSDVMANANEGNLWITLQTHPNIVAVAALKNLTAIILTNKRIPEEETIEKAEKEALPIASSKLSTFEIGGLLYQRLRC